jgi:hypothetical protein
MYKLVFDAPVRHPFLTSALFAALLALAAVVELNSPERPDDAQWAADMSTRSVPQEPMLNATSEIASEPWFRQAAALAEVVGRVRAGLNASPEQPDDEFSVETATVAPGVLLGSAAPEPPEVVVPEVGLVFVDAAPAVLPEQAHKLDETATASLSQPATSLDPIDRDLFVAKGEEMLGRGDVGGARLFFQPAAERGDAHAAIGMARTFDPKVLRTLRVYGVRPDADRAAYWYARSKELETLALAR